MTHRQPTFLKNFCHTCDNTTRQTREVRLHFHHTFYWEDEPHHSIFEVNMCDTCRIQVKDIDSVCGNSWSDALYDLKGMIYTP